MFRVTHCTAAGGDASFRFRGDRLRWAILLILVRGLAWASQQAGSQPIACTQDRALRCVRAVNSAVAQYYWQFGSIPTRLSQLGRPKADRANAEGADLITQDLASGNAQGCTVKLASLGRKKWVITAGPFTGEPPNVSSTLRIESEAEPDRPRR
jgi:hypothetical protein